MSSSHETADTNSTPTRLAAIVFTDIAGYSQLMEEDEERTIRILKEHNEVVLPLVERSGGEVIDAIGDGLFILFPSVREAVICAVAVQEAIEARNADAPERDRFHLRIGVHLGEIWREDHRVFGNGVNVAARVQPKARPGGVCITEDVFRQVSNKLSHEIRSIGTHELRNISRRMELFQVVTGHEHGEDPSEGGSGGRPADEPRGELDEIKQRILQEREKIARTREESGRGARVSDGRGGDAAAGERGGSFESQIESKVYTLVEKVMDKAISKWDEMPEEKKARAVARIQHELAREGSDRNVVVRPGAGVSISTGKEKSKKKKGDSDLGSKFGTGLVFGVGFGVGLFYFGIDWMVWPFIFLGILPTASGLVSWIRQLARHERERRDRPRELERTMLSTASDLGGTVTVVQVASRTGLPLDEVQTVLDRMTAKGYVTQNVRESGVIEYEFPSLIGPGGGTGS